MDTQPNPDDQIPDDMDIDDVAALVRARLTPKELDFRRTWIMALIDFHERTPEIRIWGQPGR